MNPTPSEVVSPPLSDGDKANLNGKAPAGPQPDGRPGFYERLFRWLFPGFHIPLQLSLWNGDEFMTAPGTPIATGRINERSAFLGMLLNPELGFGDASAEGRLAAEGDLAA